MDFHKGLELQNLDPEVSAYIYQLTAEFMAFTTPETVVSVVAKDPLELQHSDSYPNGLPPATKLKRMYRISISLSENGTDLEAEGLNENIFEALRLAKEKLLITLNDINDEVISQSDRQQEIKNALDGSENLH